MAEGNVQLRLKATLDLEFLRAQIASIGKSLRTPDVSIVATLNTKQLQKDLSKLSREVRIKINDSALIATTERIKALEQRLKSLQDEGNKAVIGVTAKAAVTQKDARKVRSGVYRSIMENGGKILLPVGLQPISQTAVNAFKADLQKKLGSINIKVQPSAGGAAPSATPGRSPGFQSARESISNLNVEQLRKRAFSSLGSESRSAQQVANWLDTIVQQGLKGSAKTKQLNAIRDFLAESLAQAAGRGVEGRMAGGGGGQGPLGKSLDTFARGLFRMLGMDPAQVRAERQARLMPPAINWQAQVPRRITPIGPSATGRALPGAAAPAMLSGTNFASQKRLVGDILSPSLKEVLRGAASAFVDSVRREMNAAVRSVSVRDFGNVISQVPMLPAAAPQAMLPTGRRGGALAVQGELGDFYRTVEVQVRNTFDIIADYHERSLRNFKQGYQQAISNYHQNILTAAASRSLRYAQVVDLGPSARPALAGGAAPPMLPPAGGSGFRGGGGFVPPGGFPSDGPQGPRRPLPGAPRTDLPANYFQSVRRGLDLSSAMRGADQYLRQARVPLAGAIEELGGEFAQATKQVLLYGAAYKGLAFFMDLPNQALSAAAALQTFRNQLNAVTGSADNASRSFGFVDGLADRFAVPLASIRQGFVRMYASMEPAGFGASEIEGLFSGISKAAATFGMSREQVDRVTYAFSQMASKGQIMAEELRGQLGDVLPGSLALFAKAAQMELPEFTKAMEDGRFSGEAMRVVLNNVAILLNQQFAKGADGAANTLQGALNQMQNSLQRLYEAFEPLVAQVAQQVFPLISSAINDATAAVKAFAASAQGNQGPTNMLSSGARGIYDAMKVVEEIARAVGGVLQQLTPTLATVGRSIAFVIEQLARLTNTPIGAFLANWLLQTTLLVGALQLLAKAGILQALAALARFNGGIGIAIQRLKLLILTSNTARLGLIALGGGLVFAALSSLTQHLEGVYNKMLGIQQAAKNSAQAIAAMSQTEATVRARSVEGEIATLKRLQQSTKGVTGGMVSASATEITALARAGASPGVAFTGPLLDEAKGTYGAGFVDPTQVGAAILKLEDDLARLRQQARPVEMPSAALQDIPPSAGDTEAAAKLAAKKEKEQQEALERAQRESENYARQQAQLITATADFQNKQDELRFQHLESLAAGQLDHAKAMIDAKHDYEMAGANEIHARQLRYYKEQKDIQLHNLRSVRDAIGKIQDAQMRLEAARRSKAAVEQAASIMPAQSAASAGGSGNANLTGYLTRLSYLETRLKNVPNAEGSGAMGFFQTKGPFHREATAASGGKNSRSSNFAEASQAVASWIEKHRPEAYSAILSGQFDKADSILSVGTWPSLPGGSQAQPSAVQAQARQYLPGGSLAARPAPILPASRPMPSMRKGGVFQGFPITSVPGESRAYRGGVHEGYDVATPINTALSYAIGGIVKKIDNVGKGHIGKMVEVELENGVIGFSGHLNEVLVQAGQRFAANQIIARTGDTGVGGAHLHQESAPFGYKKGRAAESMAYLQLGGARAPGVAASGPRHSMAKAGQEASFDVELAELELANVKAKNIKKIIQELSVGSEQLRASLAAQVAEVFPVEQMEMEAALMERRNQLVMAGAPSEYIEAQQSIAKGDMERVVMLQYMTERLGEIKAAQEGFAKEVAKGGPYVDFFKRQLKDAEDSAKLYEDAIAGAGAKQQRFNLIVLEGALAELKNADALKAMQEAVGMVKSAVEGVMGSYKNFVGEVLKGGSLKDAAKRLQEALRDQAVTMFLDFAMKPMQKFLEDSLLKVFGLESEEQQRQKSLAKLQEQINLLSQIRDNTAKVSGPTSGMSETGQSLGLSSYAGSRAGGISELPQVQSALKMASQIPSQINSLPNTMEQASQALQGFQMKTALVTTALKQQSTDAGASGAALQQNLGKTVSAIGLAAGAITSIAGGISQIKEGGISGVLGGIGSIFMGVGGALGGFNSMFPGLFAPKTAANGALWKGGFTPFANGGVVNGPTLGLVGEGKYNEAIVPLPDGRSIPVKMAGGQSAREAMSNGGMPSYAPSTVSFSFETTKINGVEYVSRDQLELAMASTRREAIKEGAKRGMSMTLDKIQQSPGTRRSIAMGRR